MRIVNVFIAMLLLLSQSQVGQADILHPDGLSVGDQYRIIFVTSDTRNGQSSNIDDYNEFVANSATSSAALTSRLVGAE